MNAKRITRKFLRTSAFIVGGFLVLLTAFHFWLVNHAEDIIQDLVSSKSNGRIRLEVKNFKFNWFSKKMELEDALFYTTDSVNAGTTYRFRVKTIKLNVKALYPVLFENKVLINNISLDTPNIVVTRLQASKDSSRGSRVSLPQEMGRIYNSIQDALKVLKVKKFEIEGATFTLINKIQPDQRPVVIGRIDFHIDNLNVDTGRLTGKEKIFFSDNIVLKSRDQEIIFPDGRHKLGFRKFRINIEKRIVEFDSCTIAALKTDNSGNDFSIYFDELVMTNIDFTALYHKEVIKADSVYCTNPQFKINLDLSNGKRNTAPQLEDIIRQLTGDLMLNFVVVNNASFDIRSVRNGKPNSFKSENNNFEMQGLTIDQEAKKPIKVKKFAMAIRNYETFLKDSTYEMQFDSILFNDDRLVLNDFTFRKLLNGKTLNSFKVPRFQLSGLSWDDLLFNQKLTATQATLYNPVIDYTVSKKSTTKKRDIFESLSEINDVIALDDLVIINGNIDLTLNDGVKLKLNNATTSIKSNSLLASRQLSAIRKSVNYLSFTSGHIKVNDINIELDSIKYSGSGNNLSANTARVRNDRGTFHAIVKGVSLDQIIMNEKTGDLSIGAVSWKKADLKLTSTVNTGMKGGSSFINLMNINGNNTTISGYIGKKKVETFLEHIGATGFYYKSGENPRIAALVLNGRDLSITDQQSNLAIKEYDFRDLQKTILNGFKYFNQTGNDSIRFISNEISFVPSIQSVINKDYRLSDMRIEKPIIRINIWRNEAGAKKPWNLPTVKVNKITVDQPEVNFFQQGADSLSINWAGRKTNNNYIVLEDFSTEATIIKAGGLNFLLNNFIYADPSGKNYDAKNGEIKAMVRDMMIFQNSELGMEWKGTVGLLNARDFILDSLGKKSGQLEINSMQLKELSLRSTTLSSMRKIVAENKKFRLDQLTGSYIDTVKQFRWYNAGYDKNIQSFFADSFSFRPTPSRDSFIAKTPYQTDHIVLKTGAIDIGAFDIDRYLEDTIVSLRKLRVDNIVFDDYRDKRKPYKAGAYKPLMVDRLKTLPIKLSLDSVILNNATFYYTEVNPKTNQAGKVLFNRALIRMFPVRNFDLGPTDSLRIQANGYLMDSIWVRLRLKESYRDSLAGFLFTVRMKPADMRILNPILVPLTSASLVSANMDTLSMRVAGNSFLGFGEMELKYHDLKVRLYKNGSPKRTGFMSFIANTFVIRHNNEDRKGNVFFIRDPLRSPLNYLIKLLFSGVTSSVGAKSNRKLMRQYKKELRERNLPPVDYD